MSLLLDEDESFSMEAYVETPGYQRVALSGYLVDRRADGTYIAPLIPQLFYGADGTQLQTWRQNLSTAGSQVILSRSGGQPSVPREDLYWRKVSEDHVEKEEVKALQPTQVMAIPSWVIPVAILGVIVGGFIIYKLAK
jgi:hypothetical protein